jgi:F-type H+-transporting ATPase subunit epsilon
MSNTLHLRVTTPAQILVRSDNVAAVQAEDQSGSFGILPGHADLLTVLVPSVLRWRMVDGATAFCAVHGGVFTVASGCEVAVACREGVVGDSLEELEEKVRALRAQELEGERKARIEQLRLHALAVRQLVRYLRPNLGPVGQAEREPAP